MPQKIREKITLLPIRFKDRERIQLAEHLPVDISDAKERYIGNECWYEISSSDNQIVYYGGESKRIVTIEVFDALMQQWIKDNSKEK